MRSVIKLELPENCRVIAVSDIHTCYKLLDKLLKKSKYCPGEDFLVIVGDIVEHREENIESLEYISKLCQNDRVYCLLGNNDTYCISMAYTYPYDTFEWCFNYKSRCFRQMAYSVGYDHCSKENWQDMRKAVTDKYGSLFEFIQSLPICLETQEHIFVHAGLENRPDWENTEDDFALFTDWFLRKQNPTSKTLIVGHYPTYNFRRSKATNLPVFDMDKKIIDIDGGLGIKQASQMNLFIINKDGRDYTYDVIWDTPYEKRTVKEDFSSGLDPVYIEWKNHDITVINKQNGIAYVRDAVTDGEGYIPEGAVYMRDGKPHVYQFLSAFPDVKKGEQVSVCGDSGDFRYVITERAQVGWIPAKIIS